MIKSKIGENAGLIWNLLDKNSEFTVSNLQKESGLNNRDFFMAVGWLARENKIYFFDKNGKQHLCLTEL